MATVSAGILMYRHSKADILVLLVHPGGPFWRSRDLGAWSIPKGELDDGEDAEAAARREFKEELGIDAPGPLRPLGYVRQRAGKIVHAFALEGTLDVDTVRSNEIEIEWPARSSRTIRVPEIDAQHGSLSPLRVRGSLPASNRFSIASNRSVMVHRLRKADYNISGR